MSNIITWFAAGVCICAAVVALMAVVMCVFAGCVSRSRSLRCLSYGGLFLLVIASALRVGGVL